MTDKKQTDNAEPYMLIAGQPATKQERKRILGARAIPTVKDERATKPISTMSRGFKLLR